MKNRDIINLYQKLYNLPKITSKEKVDFDFFRLCRVNNPFVVICIYNAQNKFLFLRDIDKNIGWEFPGGHIQEEETIEEAINRIVLKETGLLVDELRPICIVQNIFEYQDKKIILEGIAFISLASGRLVPKPENIKSVFSDKIPPKMAYQNKDIVKIAKCKIQEEFTQIPCNEIESVRKRSFFYFLHHCLIKPIGSLASHKIHREFLKLVKINPESIINVSCGDDKMVFDLEKIYKPKFFIANDISWKTISFINKKKRSSRIIFTNHNVLTLPFQDKFDLTIFKNTLHHIHPSEQYDLVKKLKKISKQLIIIDIEDPHHSTFLARLWHWYYTFFLGDQGNNFLPYSDFQKIIKKNFPDQEVEFRLIRTIKGRYCFASILDKSNSKEVELKVHLKNENLKNLRKKIVKLGFNYQGSSNELDIYFTSLHKDYLQSRECLRIRQKGNYKEITYKGSTTESMKEKRQFWKSEINIPINSSVKEASDFLSNIGFREVARVSKKREKFSRVALRLF